MPGQNFLRFAKKHPLRLLALGILGVLMTACGVTTQANQNVPTMEAQPTAEPSAVVTEAPTEIPLLEIAPLTLPSSTELPQIIGGELALFYLKEIYKDNVTGWWVDILGSHAEYKFVDASGVEVTVKTANVKFDSVGKAVAIFDDSGNPIYTRLKGVWVQVAEIDPTSHLIREKNLDGRLVNWNEKAQKWELSMPVTNEQLAQLGPYYYLENENLVYNGPAGKLTVAELSATDTQITVDTSENGEFKFAREDMSVVSVDGMDATGSPIKSILTMKADGWGPTNTIMMNPKWGEWRLSIDTVSSRSESDFANFTEITYDDVISDSLLYSLPLQPYTFPADTPPAQLNVLGATVISNEWILSEFPNLENEMNFVDQAAHAWAVTSKNDPMQIAARFRMVNPESHITIPVVSEVFHVGNGLPDLYVPVGIGGQLDGGLFNETIASPRSRYIFPIVSVEPGKMYCGVGGLGSVFDQTDTVCNLVGDGAPAARTLLPKDLQATIATFDNLAQGQGGQGGQIFPVEGNWVYKLQNIVIPGMPAPTNLPESFYK